MAFHYYFNMEPLAIKIAENHIARMSDNNFINGDEVFLDDDKLMNNLENGFVALTQLSCYLESFLNTVLNMCMKYEGESLLKCSVEEKLEIIFMHYGKDLKVVKSNDVWGNYRAATRVRNEMIHYKKTSIGWGGNIPNFDIGKQDVANYFIKENMKKVYKKYILLCEMIANELGLKISFEPYAFTCYEQGIPISYVYNPKEYDF